jgi:hypothetical protein
MDTKRAERNLDIVFLEERGQLAEALALLGGPGGARSPLHTATARFLRERQLERLRGRIHFLRKKQEELNRRVEEYVQSLHSLMRTVETGPHGERTRGADRPGGGSPRTGEAGTRVRCRGCGCERTFEGLLVVHSAERKGLPGGGPVVVDDHGTLRRGAFCCRRCGECYLAVEDRPAAGGAPPGPRPGLTPTPGT